MGDGCVAVPLAGSERFEAGQSVLPSQFTVDCTSSRRDELDQALPIVRAQLLETISTCGALTSMPQDRFFDAPGPPVVPVADVPIDGAGQSQPSQRRRARLLDRGKTLRIIVGELGAHVMQQHVGVWVNRLVPQLRKAMRRTGCQCRRVASRAARLIEEHPAACDASLQIVFRCDLRCGCCGRLADEQRCGDTQRLLAGEMTLWRNSQERGATKLLC